MRTWGRVYAEDGSYEWVKVETDPAGSDDYVWVTTLIQALLLNLGESPFYADYGIPAHPSVVQQVFPDFYVYRTQQQFSPYFASLIITKRNDPTPTYDVALTLNNGTKVALEVPR